MTKIVEKEKKKLDKSAIYIYVGPTLPGGKLKSNSVFNGTKEDVDVYLAGIVEIYPQVAKMLVPTSELASAREKIKTSGNIMNKYYNDILNKIKNEEMEG